MRKIDSAAYNKRLHSELMELDKLLHRINPEHIDKLDTELIKTATVYQKILSEAVWSDQTNFNGIELSKVKSLLSHIKMAKHFLHIGREIFEVRDHGDESQINETVSINVPDRFDGRNSFINCLLSYKNKTSGDIGLRRLSIEPLYIGGREKFDSESKLICRKNATNITIEISHDENYDYSWAKLIVFYMLWRR